MADSPFANTTDQSPNPSFLRPSNLNNGGGWAGGISNMVKALIAGNDKYMAGQKMAPQSPAAPAQPPGEPLSLAPPTPTPTPDMRPPSPAVNIPPLPQPRPEGAPVMPAPTMAPAPAPSMPLWQANAGGASPVGASPMMRSPPNLPWMPASGMLAANGDSSKVPGLPNGTDPTIAALFGGSRG